ncbi:hypothetical protein IHV09_08855 [Fictibacillus sp. 23RED33]|uniref:hypothetical protein n=1 Tax=Fictibacillus sp. 23RED33 TaxID=2745879 RepID=UPI0018CD1C83|nr:hypothetical protein [Fictibacillus sp. 23RED33]MBH0173665.1 hypothetical protein [Fictibacillus sp. 23RED33]
MKRILIWFIEPYIIIRQEWKLLSTRNTELITAFEKRRIKELQFFNIMLAAVYTLFFYMFVGDLFMLIRGNWVSLLGVVFGFLMMVLIKKIQVSRYLKRRDAYLKNDETLIEK